MRLPTTCPGSLRRNENGPGTLSRTAAFLGPNRIFGVSEMRQSPMLWGMGLACALGGAVAGTSLGSSPVIAADSPMILNKTQHGSQPNQNSRSALLPDRYPLVTRAGIVPVEHLADRGLYRQARYGAVFEQSVRREERTTDPALFVRAQAIEPTGGENASPAFVEDSPPLDLAKGPVTLASNSGSAKTIDVAAALAAS